MRMFDFEHRHAVIHLQPISAAHSYPSSRDRSFCEFYFFHGSLTFVRLMYFRTTVGCAFATVAVATTPTVNVGSTCLGFQGDGSKNS